MKIVIDACALIAYLRNEPGTDEVKKYILKEECFILSTNWAEVHNDFLKRGEKDVSKKVREELSLSGIKFVERLGIPTCELAAELKCMTLGERRKASYCDCFAIAHAVRVGAHVITSDGEFSFFKEKGFPIIFFRKPDTRGILC